MAKQVFYENVEVGAELPDLVKHTTTRQLVKFVGASGDYNEIHYDKDVAQRGKLEGVIVQGMLQMSFLGQLMTDWIGEEGTLKKMNVNYRTMLYTGKDATCKGKVTKKYAEGGEYLVECAVWVENHEGVKTTEGTAVAALPSQN